jgi:hypothetical protein
MTPAAVPILLEHLNRPYSEWTLEGIDTTLGTRVALSAWDDLVALYAAQDATSPNQGLAATLSEIATRKQLPDVLALLHDTRLPYRVFFLRTLTRLRVPNRWEIIEASVSDPELEVEARHMLHQRDLRA